MNERENFWIKTEIEVKIKTKTELKNLLNERNMAMTNSGEITEIGMSKNTIVEIKGKISSTLKNITLKGIVTAVFEIIKHYIQKLFKKYSRSQF